MNKIPKYIIIILKIIIIQLLIALYISNVFLKEFLVYYDNVFDRMVSKIFLILFPILLILLIINKKYRKHIFIFTILFTLISSARLSYYNNYSMKVESLSHLHDKYNFSFFDMEITEIDKPSLGFLTAGVTRRSAKIIYNEEEIYVYYNDGWKDNYQVKKDYNKKKNDNIDELKF